MNKRILAVLTVIVVLLTGCQLAKPDADTPAQPDRLAGVFITTEYLDLFDMEEYLRENIGSIANGDIIEPNVSGQYSSRIYAVLEEKTFGNAAGGNGTTHEYRFEDLEGVILASYWVENRDSAGNLLEGYWKSDMGEGLTDVQAFYDVTDNGSQIQLSAYIYVPSDTAESCFYLNPVYQSAEGEVYLVPGTGISYSPTLGGEMTQTLSDERKLTVDGDETTDSSEIKVTVACVEVPKEVVLIQMDENNREICRAVYIPGQLPEEIVPEKTTAYILLEEHCADTVVRSICQEDSDRVEVFYSFENNICVRSSTKIQWPEPK